MKGKMPLIPSRPVEQTHNPLQQLFGAPDDLLEQSY